MLHHQPGFGLGLGHSASALPVVPALFVKGLQKGITERHLHAVFSSFGVVVDVQIARHRSGRSAGFAIVTFSTMEEAQLALQAADSTFLCGRRLQLRWYSAADNSSSGSGLVYSRKDNLLGLLGLRGPTQTPCLQFSPFPMNQQATFMTPDPWIPLHDSLQNPFGTHVPSAHLLLQQHQQQQEHLSGLNQAFMMHGNSAPLVQQGLPLSAEFQPLVHQAMTGALPKRRSFDGGVPLVSASSLHRKASRASGGGLSLEGLDLSTLNFLDTNAVNYSGNVGDDPSALYDPSTHKWGVPLEESGQAQDSPTPSLTGPNASTQEHGEALEEGGSQAFTSHLAGSSNGKEDQSQKQLSFRSTSNNVSATMREIGVKKGMGSGANDGISALPSFPAAVSGAQQTDFSSEFSSGSARSMDASAETSLGVNSSSSVPDSSVSGTLSRRPPIKAPLMRTGTGMMLAHQQQQLQHQRSLVSGLMDSDGKGGSGSEEFNKLSTLPEHPLAAGITGSTAGMGSLSSPFHKSLLSDFGGAVQQQQQQQQHLASVAALLTNSGRGGMNQAFMMEALSKQSHHHQKSGSHLGSNSYSGGIDFMGPNSGGGSSSQTSLRQGQVHPDPISGPLPSMGALLTNGAGAEGPASDFRGQGGNSMSNQMAWMNANLPLTGLSSPLYANAATGGQPSQGMGGHPWAGGRRVGQHSGSSIPLRAQNMGLGELKGSVGMGFPYTPYTGGGRNVPRQQGLPMPGQGMDAGEMQRVLQQASTLTLAQQQYASALAQLSAARSQMMAASAAMSSQVQPAPSAALSGHQLGGGPSLNHSGNFLLPFPGR